MICLQEYIVIRYMCRFFVLLLIEQIRVKNHKIMSTAHLIEMNLIKRVLEEKGIKQTWLAEKLGKSYPIINGYVQNRKQPSLEVIFEIARILKVTPSDLINNLANLEHKQ